MDFTIQIPLVVTVFLVFIRFSALLLMSPLFAIAQVPVQIRVLLLLFLSLILTLSLGITLPAVSLNFAQLIYYGFSELIIGAAMAFGLFAAFAAFSFGGRILDFQMGFGVASLIDPATDQQAPLIGTFLNMLGVMVFFLVDGHHLLLKGLAHSLSQYPPGQPVHFMLEAVVMQFGAMFTYAIMLVAPVIFTILLIDVAMAVAARTMPQVNMFIVMLPLKIFVGLVVLMLSLVYLLPLMKKIYTSIFIYWQQLFVLPA